MERKRSLALVGPVFSRWTAHDSILGGFFYFFYFLFLFFTKIYFRFGNLQEYTPAARQRGGRGISKKIRRENCAQVPGGRSPGSGAAGPGRPSAGRPAVIFEFRLFHERISHMCSFCNFLQKQTLGRRRNMWRRDNTSWRHRLRRRCATHALLN